MPWNRCVTTRIPMIRVPSFHRGTLVVLALACLLRPSPADAEELGFIALLNGQNQVPPIVTAASAVAHVVLNTETGRIRYEVQHFDIINLLQIHIHLGGPIVNGPVIYSLSRSGENLISGEQAFRPEDVDDLLSGGLYVNAHTFVNATGEIRGQLLPGSLRGRTVSFQQPLAPENLAPPVLDLQAGAASLLTLDLRLTGERIAAGSAVFEIEYRFPASVTINGLHVHEGAAGVAGPVVLSSGLTATTDTDGRGRLVFKVPATSVAEIGIMQAILDDPARFFIDLHTGAYPEGALRGPLHRGTPLLAPRTRLP
jgi:hypothetical protein